MIRQSLYFLGTVLLCSLIAIIVSNWALLAAQNGGGATLTVVATVRPQRIIVVDQNLSITQIISNTNQDMRPLVVLNTVDGPEIPYSESIVRQYAVLKPTLDFSHPAIVYDRSTRGFIPRLMKLFFPPTR